MRSIQAIVLIVQLVLGADVLAQVTTPPSAADSCRICSADGRVECPTCRGSGEETIACPACSARGIVDCARCVPVVPKLIPLAGLDSEERKRLAELTKALEEFVGASKATTSANRGAAKKGYIDCPNSYCRGGRMLWQDGKTNPCRVCRSRGRIKCPDCRAGKRKCLTCAGRRNVGRACRDCRGDGQLACPGCRIEVASAACPLCDGAKVSDCGACRRSRHAKVACGACSGAGNVACRNCEGGAKLTCDKCGGCGKVRVVITGGGGGSGGIKGCEECDGRGYDVCSVCVRGKAECLRCSGKKKVVPDRSHKAGCRCITEGPGGGWELLGDLLIEAGVPRRARSFFERAKQFAVSVPEALRESEEVVSTRGRLDEKIERAKSAAIRLEDTDP